MAIQPEPDDLYKEQARSLREFLQQGGVTLKHTHALEAIARIHGERNWHLLSSQAKRNRRPVWLISTYDENGVARSAVAEDILTAVSLFLHGVYVMCSQSLTRSVEVLGRDEDGEDYGLYLFLGDRITVTLTKPAWSEVGLDSPPLPLSQLKSLSEMARLVQEVVDGRPIVKKTMSEVVVERRFTFSQEKRRADQEPFKPRESVKVASSIDRVKFWEMMAQIQIRLVTPAI